MNIRNYNIYFHTHTISGIIISAILYVIFFAGSFSFFKDQISNWQKNTSYSSTAGYNIDINTITDSLNKEYGLYGRKLSFYLYPHKTQLGVSISESKDTINKKQGGFFYMNTLNFQKTDYDKSYDLGEFLYRLHFLAQLNEVGNLGFPLGYYIAGFVAFIFLFAIITGVLVHWNKIISNFYVFRPWEKLKTVWTDLHTALGVITLPFLFVFAVTGSYFLISYPLFTKPTATFKYGGDEDKLFEDLGYGEQEIAFQNKPLKNAIDINSFLIKTQQQWPRTELSSLDLINYGDETMQVEIKNKLPQKERFISDGSIIYDVASGKIVETKNPYKPAGYNDTVSDIVYTLHFGSYGGYAIKILYFLLGICGCMVIISGVLIWLTARNKKNIPEKKRKFNEWLTHIYLAIALSMYPVTAIAFIAVKLKPDGGTGFIYPFYFFTWMAVCIMLLLRRNNYKISRDCLLAGSTLGLLVPVINGIVTRNWIWRSYKNGYQDILLIDVFWILLSIGTFICWWLMVRKQKQKQFAV